MTHVGQLSRRTSDTSSWGIRGPAGSRPCWAIVRCAYAIPVIARWALFEAPSYPSDTPALLLRGRRATRGPSFPRNRWSASRSLGHGPSVLSRPAVCRVVVSGGYSDRVPVPPGPGAPRPSLGSLGCVLQGSATLEDSALWRATVSHGECLRHWSTTGVSPLPLRRRWVQCGASTLLMHPWLRLVRPCPSPRPPSPCGTDGWCPRRSSNRL